MGYFICFDIADETDGSLKEAMKVYNMLQDKLNKNTRTKMKPIVWFIGCKSDRTLMFSAVERNKESAQHFSDQNEIPLHVTSARDATNISSVFHEMIQAICSRENLWTLEAAD